VFIFNQKPTALVISDKTKEFWDLLFKMSVRSCIIKKRQKGLQATSNNLALRARSAIIDEKTALT